MQVLIIPEDESQTSDLLHIYQILVSLITSLHAALLAINANPVKFFRA